MPVVVGLVLLMFSAAAYQRGPVMPSRAGRRRWPAFSRARTWSSTPSSMASMPMRDLWRKTAAYRLLNETTTGAMLEDLVAQLADLALRSAAGTAVYRE